MTQPDVGDSDHFFLQLGSGVGCAWKLEVSGSEIEVPLRSVSFLPTAVISSKPEVWRVQPTMTIQQEP